MTVLRDLNAADGPEGSCFERWERWWDQCARQRIRLEDCTGNLLGTLPEDPQDEEEGTDEDVDSGEEEEQDDDDDEYDDEDGMDVEADEDGMGFKIRIPARVDDGPFSELRQLLDECRKMSAEREESPFVPPGWHY